MAESLRQEVVVEKRHAQKQVELRAQSHDPQDKESRGAHLIGALPGQSDNAGAKSQQRKLMVKDRADREADAPPT